MKDLAKIRLAWTTRAVRFAFIAWTIAQPAAAQQFQPVPPPAPGRSALPATPMSAQQLLSELRKGGYIILETATLAFGRAEKANEVRGGPATPDNPDRYAGLRRLFSTPVRPGANVVISSHGNTFYATAGAPYLAEGEAAVVRPLEKDFEIVARVKHDAWRALFKN